MNLTMENINNLEQFGYNICKEWDKLLSNIVDSNGYIPLAVWEKAMATYPSIKQHVAHMLCCSWRQQNEPVLYTRIEECFTSPTRKCIIAPPIEDVDPKQDNNERVEVGVTNYERAYAMAMKGI